MDLHKSSKRKSHQDVFTTKVTKGINAYETGDVGGALKIFDFLCIPPTFPNEKILYALERLYNISEKIRFSLSKERNAAPQNDALDLVQKLRDILPHSNAKEEIADLLSKLSTSFLPPHEAFMCIVGLYNNCFIDLCYDAFVKFGIESSNPITLRTDAGCYLFSSGNETYKLRAKEIISEISKTKDLNSQARYDIIMRFGSKSGIQTQTNFSKIKVAFDEEFFQDLLVQYFRNEENEESYRILSAQNLLVLESVGEELREEVESVLFDIISCSQVTNTKANAADVIMRLSKNPVSITKAQEIIEDLGYGHLLTKKGVEKTRTLYNNSQNAHEFIDQSSRIISRLYKEYADDRSYNRTFDEIKGDILNLMGLYSYEEERKERIIKVLHRIYVDTATFTEDKLTLEEIFTCIWYKITKLSETHPELDLRVLEEIADVDDACSSGHFTRLVSVLCEYDGSMTINFTQQIIANALARMQVLIRDCEDENLRCHIALAQSVLSEEEDVIAYNAFITSTIPNLKEELREEFVGGGFVEEEEFEVAFKKASETWII